MLAVLMTCKFFIESSEKDLTTLTRSSLMMSQHDWKKFEVKPSGAGALSVGRSIMARLISSSENGGPKSSRYSTIGSIVFQLKSIGRVGGVPRFVVK